MQLGSLRVVLLRHWLLALAAVFLTLAGMIGATSVVKPEYKTTGSVVLIPPANAEEPNSNRYLALGTLDQAVGVLIRSLMSEQNQRAVEALAPGGTYEVAPDYATNAPILVVTVTGDSRGEVERLLQAALDSVPKVLVSLQAAIGVDTSERIATQSLTSDTQATVVLKPVIRAVLGTGVLLMVTCLGLIALLDGICVRRQRKLAGARKQGAGEKHEAAAPDLEPRVPLAAQQPVAVSSTILSTTPTASGSDRATSRRPRAGERTRSTTEVRRWSRDHGPGFDVSPGGLLAADEETADDETADDETAVAG